MKLIIFLKYFYHKFAPPEAMSPDEPRYWKERILYNLILLSIPGVILLITGALPYILREHHWFLLASATCAFCFCIMFVFFSHRVPYIVRSTTVSFMIYLFGVAVIYSVGPFVASREWLLLFSIVATILLGWPGAVFSILLNTMTLIVTALIIDQGFWIDLFKSGNPVMLWFQIAADIFFINLASTLFLAYFFSRIERSDRAARSSAVLLDAERSKIFKAHQALEIEIEERKRSEKDRRLLEQQLQRSQKMEAIGTLAGGVAHDLNNILSGIVSYPELILLELPSNSPIRKPLLTIQKSGLKAAAVVQDLLTLARRGIFETKVVNLNDIIAEYLDSPEFKNLQIEHPAITIETQLEKNLFRISGSSIHLSKTLMNLIYNGFESITGKGRLLIKTENTYVDKPLKGYDEVQEGDYIRLSISDTGAGIERADIERIFEPFYSKKELGRSGSGLGLTVVWASLQDHRGYIDIESYIGKGTTFYLYFPITDRSPEMEPNDVQLEEYLGNNEHLLVIDDVAEQIEIASGMLKSLGYRVSGVSSGEAAVEFIQHNQVDLLILDMIMDPGIDGLDTYKRILSIRPGQKAIIASGFAESDRVKSTLTLGAARFIKKPYTLKEIGRAIKAALISL